MLQLKPLSVQPVFNDCGDVYQLKKQHDFREVGPLGAVSIHELFQCLRLRELVLFAAQQEKRPVDSSSKGSSVVEEKCFWRLFTTCTYFPLSFTVVCAALLMLETFSIPCLVQFTCLFGFYLRKDKL